LAWLLIFLIFTWLTGADAAPSPLSADVTPLTLRPRTHAPAWVTIQLHSQNRTPLDGVLELQAWGEGVLLSRQQIPDVTLIPGKTTQRILLPPPSSARRAEELRVRFSTRQGAYDLGRFPVANESFIGRQYVIGVCHSDFGNRESQAQTWRALRPERLTDKVRNGMSNLFTSPAYFTPEDLPAPLGLCAFDIVVLEGPALAALNERQLGDLATWVEGGGSLCVVAARGLKAEHLAFLNRLAAAGPGSALFEREGDGALARPGAAPTPSGAAASFFFERPGIGRLVIALAAPATEEEFMADSWIRATHFLAHSNSRSSKLGADELTQWASDRSLPDRVETWLMHSLPHSIRMIPLSVLSMILGTFVLLIGPGEWLVLGRLRRRRWTWFTFPALAVGCTVFTVRAAEHYLGTGDRQLSAVFTDYSSKGVALRENRLEFWFIGRNQDAVTDQRQSLAVPCLIGSDRRMSGQRVPATLPSYQGRVPGHYTLRFPLTQWTPYVQHTLTFSPDPSLPRLHWEAVDGVAELNAAADPAKTIAMKIGAQEWNVYAFGRDHGSSVYPAGLDKDPLVTELSIDRRLLWPMTFSPGGRSDLLDLALDHGFSDWVVVAVRQVGRTIQIQRCVYHNPSDE
jgi:hypothetical protein